jgi:hypothetical protein
VKVTAPDRRAGPARGGQVQAPQRHHQRPRRCVSGDAQRQRGDEWAPGYADAQGGAQGERLADHRHGHRRERGGGGAGQAERRDEHRAREHVDHRHGQAGAKDRALLAGHHQRVAGQRQGRHHQVAHEQDEEKAALAGHLGRQHRAQDRIRQVGQEPGQQHGVVHHGHRQRAQQRLQTGELAVPQVASGQRRERGGELGAEVLQRARQLAAGAIQRDLRVAYERPEQQRVDAVHADPHHDV